MADDRFFQELASDLTGWAYAGRSVEGEPFYIEGMNVWSRDWVDLSMSLHVGGRVFGVYEVVTPGKRVVFAADEWSPAAWVFYVPTTGPSFVWFSKNLRIRQDQARGRADYEKPPTNWAERLAPYMGIMTKEEANLVFGAIMDTREQSKSDHD